MYMYDDDICAEIFLINVREFFKNVSIIIHLSLTANTLMSVKH